MGPQGLDGSISLLQPGSTSNHPYCLLQAFLPARNSSDMPDMAAVSRSSRRVRLGLIKGWLVLAVLAILLIGLVNWMSDNWDDTSSRPDSDMVVAFDLSRTSKTASRLLDVCSASRSGDDGATVVEDATGDCVPQNPAEKIAASDRPGILSANVLGDFVPCDQASRGEDDPSDGGTQQFPADQISVTGDLVGATGLRVTVVANPQQPSQVDAGTYCGRIIIERDGAPFRSVTAAVTMLDRGGFALGYAAILLAVGALVGALLKFLNDPISKLIPPYRRLRSLRRWAQSVQLQDEAALNVSGLLVDAADAISLLDAAAADEALTKLEAIRAQPSDKAVQAVAKDAGPALPRTVLTAEAPGQSLGPFLTQVFRGYWLLGLVAIVIVVVATGLATQYVQNDGFAGSQRDWIGLLAFGLAAQVTGATLGEALGRLSPGSQGTGRSSNG